MTTLVNVDVIHRRDIVSDDETDFTYREDLKRSGGTDIRLEQNIEGTHVRYMLMLREMPFWKGAVPALIIRYYDDGSVTVAEGTWMEKPSGHSDNS